MSFSPNSSKSQKITLPTSRETEWGKSLSGLINALEPGPTELDCFDWRLGCRELKKLISILENSGLKLTRVSGNIPETMVSAAALGHPTNLLLTTNEKNKPTPSQTISKEENSQKLLFHNGTLRSGDHLSAAGDVLLFGDVNPGAKISAGGDVMIWGRLRGIAHAGQNGDLKAKIVALELRPLQLRIGNVVARGPEGQPEQGLAEEAKILSGRIVIEPANTKIPKA